MTLVLAFLPLQSSDGADVTHFGPPRPPRHPRGPWSSRGCRTRERPPGWRSSCHQAGRGSALGQPEPLRVRFPQKWLLARHVLPATQVVEGSRADPGVQGGLLLGWGPSSSPEGSTVWT